MNDAHPVTPFRAPFRWIDEAEMVAEFLRGELQSPRFGKRIRTRLAEDGVDVAVVATPDPGDAEQNRYRRALLHAYRAADAAAQLFDRFPGDVPWMRGSVDRDELGRLRYMDYPFWNELSAGTRSPRRAADRIRTGETDGRHLAPVFQALIVRARACETFPPLIAVAAADDEDPVLLEGHARLTAYMLEPDTAPARVDLILGISPAVREWAYYGHGRASAQGTR